MEEVGVGRSSWKNWLRGSTDGGLEIIGYGLRQDGESRIRGCDLEESAFLPGGLRTSASRSGGAVAGKKEDWD